MTDSNPYDLIVIGCGPGGYVASIRCAQQGMRVGGVVQDLAEVCHAHPTFSEALKESALTVDEQAIHA